MPVTNVRELLTAVQDTGLAYPGIRPLTARSASCERGGMQIFGRRRTVTRVDRARLAEELAGICMSIGTGEPACCCPARPVVRVVMPTTATRLEPVDLLLCGHHYRASQIALNASGAAVYDKQGAVIMSAADQRQSRHHQAAVAA